MLSIFVIFKLHGGWLPFMLVPCCFGDITLACDIHMGEVLFLNIYKYIHTYINLDKIAVLGLIFRSLFSPNTARLTCQPFAIQ